MNKTLTKSAIALTITMLFSGCQQSVTLSSQAHGEIANTPQIKEAATPALNLHVPSPDWREQVIYFAMIDRFNDGNPSNNDQGVGVYNPKLESHYSGGDIEGVTQKLDYLEELGATAVWLTPQVANLWWNELNSFGGYHGYWARHFKKVDEHYGTLEDYQQLSSALHDKGMYLIQDIVANHTANYFYYDGEYDPSDTAKNFKIAPARIPEQAAPEQYPFNLTDRNNPEHVKANIYNWTPPIEDHSSLEQELTYQLGALSDLNTTNPLVRETLKDSYNYWLENAGVDAFRVDTVKYVEHDFWHDFLHSDNGIFPTAKNLGKEHFLVFGEVFEASAPFDNKGEQKIASFLGSAAKPELNSIIGFPMYFELNRVFAEGQPSAQLAYRLEQHMSIYPDPYVVPNFVNNHDTPRFLQFGNLKGFKQAQAAMFTIPGIPVIYQGDEQALEHTRQAMFAGGYHSSHSQFDQNSEMFTFIKKLTTLRKEHKVLIHGDLNIIASDTSGAGVIAYTRQKGDDFALVIFNSAESSRLLGELDLSKLELNGKQAELSLALQEHAKTAQQQINLGENQTPDMTLPARAIMVYTGKLTDTASATLVSKPKASITLTKDIEGQVFSESQTLAGQLQLDGDIVANSPLKLIINGDIDHAIDFSTNQEGQFNVELPITDYGRFEQSAVIYSPQFKQTLIKQNFVAEQLKADIAFKVEDGTSDGHGPQGNYQSPTHAQSGKQREIVAAEVKSSGANLELTIEMAEITNVWGSPNGFDNVSFAIFIDQPFHQGNKNLPTLNAKMPLDLTWSYGHSFFGWGNTLFTNRGASAEKEGYKLALAPSIKVNEADKTISITYQGKAIGIDSWKGTSLYITTWDKTGEGHLRELTPEPGSWTFGGGEHHNPKIMDSLLVRVE